MKTLKEAMADGTDLSGLLPGSESGSEGSKLDAPVTVVKDISSGKPIAKEPIPDLDKNFSQDELDLLQSRPQRSAKPVKKEEPEPKPIAGSPFLTAEAAIDSWKNGQREIQRLRDKLESQTPQLIQDSVRAEVDRLMAENAKSTPVETSEELALKEDDPEAYERIQLNKKIVAQDAQMQNLQNAIDELNRAVELKEVEAEFNKVSVDSGIPANLLIAYGSLEQYRQTTAEDLVPIVISDLKSQGIVVGKTEDPKPEPTTYVQDTKNLRSPVKGGSSAVVNESYDVESIGELGSKGWKEFEKKLVQVVLNRNKGGAG